MSSSSLIFSTLCSASIFSLWQNRHKLFFRPDKNLTDTPEYENVPYKDIYIDNEHFNIHGWLMKSKTNKNKKIIVLSHGNAGNMSHRLHFVEFWEKYLLSYEYDLFMYDYAGYGNSYFKSNSVDHPTVQTSQQSLEMVIRYISQIYPSGVNLNSILLYGESIGAAITATVAAKILNHSNNTGKMFDKIVLQSGFSRMHDMIKHHCPFLTPMLWFLSDDLDVYKSLQKLNKNKEHIILMHSRIDEIIPFSMYEKLVPLATTILELQGGHNSTVLDEKVARIIMN